MLYLCNSNPVDFKPKQQNQNKILSGMVLILVNPHNEAFCTYTHHFNNQTPTPSTTTSGDIDLMFNTALAELIYRLATELKPDFPKQKLLGITEYIKVLVISGKLQLNTVYF